MIILDKKENSIDIYTMKAQNEELKRYRNSIMRKHQNESHFYQLMTNSDKTIENLNKSREVDTKFLNYGLSDKSNDRIWAVLKVMDNVTFDVLKKQDEILKKYINGDYDDLLPTRVYEFVWEDELDLYLLKTEPAKKLYGNEILEMNNLLSIPKKLYLLQLLQLGEFNKLASENINGLLNLFDINYEKNIKIENINDALLMLLDSKNTEEVITKANVGTQILKRIKK